MFSFLTRAPQSRRTLVFGSAMHVWSDLYFALLIPLMPMIKEDLDLSFTQVGLLRAVFGGSSAVLQVPLGILAEGMGEFWLLISGNIWVGVGLVGMGFSPVFGVLLAVSFVAGLGGGAQHPLASSMVSRAYDDRGRSTAVGTVNFAGDLGKMAAPIVAGTMVAVGFGWHAALWAVGMAGIVFMLMAAITRQSVEPGKRPRQAGLDVNSGADNTQMGGFIALSGVGFLDSATRGAVLVFLPFVMDAKEMSAAQISFVLVFLFGGGAIGKFVLGWLGDRYSVVTLIWVTKSLTAALLVLSLFGPPLAMMPLAVALGIGLNGTSSVLYATVAELVPARRRARLYGFFYTTNEGGTILAPLVYGAIADLFSLNVAIVAMGIAAAAIGPASLPLKRYLHQKAAPAGDSHA